MNNALGIEIREIQDLDTWNLPSCMYQWVKKKWSNSGLYFQEFLIWELRWIVQNYLRIMWLDSTQYPARVDIWFSTTGNPVIYEITTWFVDQVWSCLSLQALLGDNTWLEALGDTPFDSSILTSEPYRPEYDVMRSMFEKSWKKLWEWEGERTYVYGYPVQTMRWKENYFPAWKWLEAENKFAQSRIIERLVQGTSYVYPRVFSSQDTSYEDLPWEKNTKLIFKQDTAKMKWDRNTIVFWKWKESQRRYKDGEMLAQEFISPYRDDQGKRFEAKALFMPWDIWTNFTGMYTLVDSTPISKSFWNTNIPNDGYPQWAWIIIS